MNTRRSRIALWAILGWLAWSCSSADSSAPGSGAGGSGAEGGHPGVDGITPDDGVYQSKSASNGPMATGSTTPVSYVASVQGYTLPVDLSEVANLQEAVSANGLFAWDDAAEAKLSSRGLVALSGGNTIDRFDTAYQLLKSKDLPILVTTDSTLHLYHVFFDQLLGSIESTHFVPMFRAMLPQVQLKLASMYVALDGDLKEAARRDLALVTTAAVLLDPASAVVYAEVQPEVDAELALIDKAQEIKAEPILNHGCDEWVACAGKDIDVDQYLLGNACACEDYTQYRPRGHYTQSETLTRYFRAGMLLGRFTMRIKSPIETRMAALMTAALNKTQVDYAGSNVPAIELWSRFYRVSSFFAGAADDLTFVEYDKVLANVYGAGFALKDLADDAKLTVLREQLAEERKPKIMSGFVEAFQDFTKATMGLRFSGQRFAFDSYVLGSLVFSNVGPNPKHPHYAAVAGGNPDCGPAGLTGDPCAPGNEKYWPGICCLAVEAGHPDVCRLLPKGLDVPAAFGSTRATEHLKGDREGYCQYQTKLDGLRTETTAFTDADRWKNLYTGWLFSLQPLFEEDTTGFPTWMGGTAWKDKALNTSLASWAELRHDTILYVKQSYTNSFGGNGGAPPVVPKEFAYYVEPVPEVYSRLLDLTRMTRIGLADLGLMPDKLEMPFSSTEHLLDTLTTISIHELEGQELDSGERIFIDNIGATMRSILAEVAALSASNDSTVDAGPGATVALSDEDGLKTTVVADVHTDPNTKKVLEVGSGAVDWVVAVNKLPDGTLVATIGPVFSYNEFPWPMEDRLTDPKWRDMIANGPRPERPSWVRDIYP
ncbi:MAG: DUF3160 domain-containing protein [Deltaproteobacteria bacterium]|nr:DUF3160 domain-containing protein [Deltaproteobacteria bacterium]